MSNPVLLRSFSIVKPSGVIGPRRVDAGDGLALKRSTEAHCRSGIGVDP
jgi:hypothetical protein